MNAELRCFLYSLIFFFLWDSLLFGCDAWLRNHIRSQFVFLVERLTSHEKFSLFPYRAQKFVTTTSSSRRNRWIGMLSFHCFSSESSSHRNGWRGSSQYRDDNHCTNTAQTQVLMSVILPGCVLSAIEFSSHFHKQLH